MSRCSSLAVFALVAVLSAGCSVALDDAALAQVPSLPVVATPHAVVVVGHDSPVLPPALDPGIAPVVATMPASVETSIESVARYIAAREPDRRRRIKALHDWVADRIEYAMERYHAESPPTSWKAETLALPEPCVASPALCKPFEGPQFTQVTLALPAWKATDAQTEGDLAEQAFRERRAVCAGYSALLHALGAAIGEHIETVIGQDHEWNVADTGVGYELIDVTWDAGSFDGTRWSKHYQTKYLFTSPDDFLRDHHPADRRWTLRELPFEGRMRSVHISRVDHDG